MKIRVAICQVDMEWENTARNLKRLEPIVAAADADVVVLPEMFATGFKLRPACVAEPADGLVVTTMRRWAAQYGRAVVGSVVVAEQERFRNRMFFVKPSGETAWYDKRHLFRPGGEARDYTPGDRRVIVEYMGFRFLLLVCYDLRFPELARGMVQDGADIIFVPAFWPAGAPLPSRTDHWDTLVNCTALLNQTYVVAVNQYGHMSTEIPFGRSCTVDPWGTVIAQCANRVCISYAELDMGYQQQVRERLATWPNRRPDCYTLH